MNMPTESFIDLLVAYGEANPSSMTYREGEEFTDWQARFREKLATLRGALPERTTSNVTVVESVTVADHTRHLLSIQVSAVSTLVAYLLIPRDISATEHRPGLLVSHGHTTYGIDSVCGVRGMDEGDNNRRAYALDAVRDGYVVLAPAWWGWGGPGRALRPGRTSRSLQRDSDGGVNVRHQRT